MTELVLLEEVDPATSALSSCALKVLRVFIFNVNLAGETFQYTYNTITVTIAVSSECLFRIRLF